MLDLLSEHEYAGITVEQIIRRADVVRATFYAHVADKDELFRDVVSELTSSLVEDASAVAPVESFSLGGAAVYQLFRHAERYPHVYVPMIRGAAEGIPLALFRTALVAGYLNLLQTQESALEITPRLPLEFIARAWVGEHLDLVAWWLEERPPYDAAELTRMRLLLMTQGLAWARGLPHSQMTFDEELFARIVANDPPAKRRPAGGAGRR
jgi:AcrR family transcriptional regulator